MTTDRVRLFMAITGVSGALAVAFGAFGAHALEARVSADLLATYETGSRYHFYHTFALFGVVLALGRWPRSALPVAAGWLFVTGMLLFSGSLYVLALTGATWLGMVTPIGGVAFICAWLLLALAVRNGRGD